MNKIGTPKATDRRMKLDCTESQCWYTMGNASQAIAWSLHVSRLKSFDMVKQDHKIALHLVAGRTDQDRLVQDIWRAGIVHGGGRFSDFGERRGVIPLGQHRCIACDVGGPELLSPPCGRITPGIHTVSQGRQVRRVASIAFW